MNSRNEGTHFARRNSQQYGCRVQTRRIVAKGYPRKFTIRSVKRVSRDSVARAPFPVKGLRRPLLRKPVHDTVRRRESTLCLPGSFGRFSTLRSPSSALCSQTFKNCARDVNWRPIRRTRGSRDDREKYR